MIKAEVITHEGNPTPNWLDRCRTLLEPAKGAPLLLLILAIAVTAFIIYKHNQVAYHEPVSTIPASNAPTLTVDTPSLADQVNSLTDNNGAQSTSPLTNNSDANSRLGAPRTKYEQSSLNQTAQDLQDGLSQSTRHLNNSKQE